MSEELVQDPPAILRQTLGLGSRFPEYKPYIWYGLQTIQRGYRWDVITGIT